MTRRPARATQAEIRRAIAAANKAGVNMAVEILPDGTIRLSPQAAKPVDDSGSDTEDGKRVML